MRELGLSEDEDDELAEESNEAAREIFRLTEALRFYAETTNWHRTWEHSCGYGECEDYQADSQAVHDEGARARRALGLQ